MRPHFNSVFDLQIKKTQTGLFDLNFVINGKGISLRTDINFLFNQPKRGEDQTFWMLFMTMYEYAHLPTGSMSLLTKTLCY